MFSFWVVTTGEPDDIIVDIAETVEEGVSKVDESNRLSLVDLNSHEVVYSPARGIDKLARDTRTD